MRRRGQSPAARDREKPNAPTAEPRNIPDIINNASRSQAQEGLNPKDFPGQPVLSKIIIRVWSLCFTSSQLLMFHTGTSTAVKNRFSSFNHPSKVRWGPQILISSHTKAWFLTVYPHVSTIIKRIIQEMILCNDSCPEGSSLLIYNISETIPYVSSVTAENTMMAPSGLCVKMRRHPSHVGCHRAPYWGLFSCVVIL